MDYLRPEDWNEVMKRWPACYNFLVHQSIVHELEILKDERRNMNGIFVDPRRLAWVEDRIKSLEWGLGINREKAPCLNSI